MFYRLLASNITVEEFSFPDFCVFAKESIFFSIRKLKGSFVSGVLKLHKDVLYYGSIFVHCTWALSRLFNMETQVLEFWEILSNYFSNFLSSGLPIFLFLEVLLFGSWNSRTDLPVSGLHVLPLSLHSTFSEIFTLSSNSSSEFLTSVDIKFLMSSSFLISKYSFQITSCYYFMVSIFCLSWDSEC